MNKKFVVQANKLIEAHYYLSTGEQKLIHLMASMIRKNHDDFHSYEFTIKDLAKILEIDITNAYRDISSIADRLLGQVLHIKLDTGWLKTVWISSCEYHDGKGTISLSFDPKLKPFLLGMKANFTKYDLLVIIQFKSQHTIRIYQLLKQYIKFGKREFTVIDLKEKLGLKKTQYPIFTDFRRFIIDKVKKEFEEKDENGKPKCDLTFILETIKEGRKITSLRFIIIPQICTVPAVKADEMKPAPAQAAKNHPPLSAEMQEFEQWLKENDAFMYGFMQEYGPNALMVQAEYRNFLERREEALQG